MSIYKLTDQNFQLVGTQQAPKLSIKIQDPIFVMFKLQSCAGCKALEPVFSQLANTDQRIKYGILDLTEYKKIAVASQNTPTPITKVPVFMIFSQGLPYDKFLSQKKQLSDFLSFVNKSLADIYQQMQQPRMIDAPQQSFVQQPMVNNMYGGSVTNGQQYVPDMPNIPKSVGKMMNGSHQHAQSSQHPSMKQCDPDDQDCLAMIDGIIPHNAPWEDKFGQLGL